MQPLAYKIKQILNRLDSLEERIAKLEGETTEEPSEPVQEDEYPEFVQPTGAHDAYNIGDKVTYNGKKYICQINGCVWAPDVYPQGWQEVTEE